MSEKTQELVLAQRRIKNQRVELRRLGRYLQNKKWESIAKAYEKHIFNLNSATAAMKNLTDDKAWQAGMHFGMKLARAIIQSDVPVKVVEDLDYEIGWRFEGKPHR